VKWRTISTLKYSKKGPKSMIKNIKKLALAATATLLLAACAETAKTADWYIQNTAEQAIKLTECQQRPETLKNA
jgi:hypothetical protein